MTNNIYNSMTIEEAIKQVEELFNLSPSMQKQRGASSEAETFI